jgi:hypothetical protein
MKVIKVVLKCKVWGMNGEQYLQELFANPTNWINSDKVTLIYIVVYYSFFGGCGIDCSLTEAV